MSEPEQRKLAAIMFTDIVGYSALTQRDEKLTLELLVEHFSLVRALLPSYQGNEIKTIGDAFLVQFRSAVEAVNCAVEIQRALHERNLKAPPERRVQIRIGLHVGDVIFRDNDVFGDGVNIAARVEPLAEPGGICITEDVARQIRNKVEYPYHQLGERTLKNIEFPISVYRVDLPWLKAEPGKGRGEKPEAAEAPAPAPPKPASAAPRPERSPLVLAGGAVGLIALLVVLFILLGGGSTEQPGRGSDQLAASDPGQKAFKSGDYATAAREFQREVERNPKNDQAFYFLGRSYSESGQSKEAVEALNQAVLLDGNKPDYRVQYALALEALARLKESIEQYRAAIALGGTTAFNVPDLQKRLSTVQLKQELDSLVPYTVTAKHIHLVGSGQGKLTIDAHNIGYVQDSAKGLAKISGGLLNTEHEFKSDLNSLRELSLDGDRLTVVVKDGKKYNFEVAGGARIVRIYQLKKKL